MGAGRVVSHATPPPRPVKVHPACLTRAGRPATPPRWHGAGPGYSPAVFPVSWRRYALMKASRSPSITPCTSGSFTSVRWSLTIV